DATAWMAAYALNLMRIAIELALRDPTYEDMAEKFFEHFLLIAVTTISARDLEKLPSLQKRMRFFLENRPDLATLVSRWNVPG
ncbi:hypothetical protein, partial [Methylobacterium sp. WL7]|uniref:hypothetical protein n=1 Tax=Methylobacterium sp. WL7 TaxID=2603900 RepID=UPI0011C885A7